VATGLGGTYIGGIGSSAGPTERIMTFFGGTSQDRHFYLLVFDAANPASRRLLNTKASTLDGRPIGFRLDFLLHAAAIDRSGRYVTLYPTSADRAAPRQAAPNYLWDLATDTFTELPSIAARSNGHDAYGYGVRVNQDCCTSTTWDAAQWQLRALASPLVTHDLITPVLTPAAGLPRGPSVLAQRAGGCVDAVHQRALSLRRQPGRVAGVGRRDRRGADQEAAGQVWRLAHHRSDVRHDTDPLRLSFWYTPRPNVSPDGQWVLFTSNWEKTLGTDPGGDAGGSARQDVFLLRLTPAGVTGGAPPDAAAAITTTSLPDGRLQRLYSTRLAASGVAAGAMWRVAAGALPPGLVLHPQTGAIGGAPRQAGTFTFTVSVGGASRAFVLVVR
jgi:hypothetical protein